MEKTAYFLTKLRDRQLVEMVPYSQSWGSNHYVLQTQEVRVYISIFFYTLIKTCIYVYVYIWKSYIKSYISLNWMGIHACGNHFPLSVIPDGKTSSQNKSFRCI